MTAATAQDARIAATLRRQPLTVTGFIRRFYFVFAVVLCVVLYAVTSAVIARPIGADQLATFAPLALVAIASTPAVIAGGGGIDLSIGPNMVLSNIVIVAALVPAGVPAVPASLIAIVISTLVGALNGAASVLLRLGPIVVTLATYFILTGVNQFIAPTPVVMSDTSLAPLANFIGPVPGALITIGAPLVLWGVIGATRLGRTVLAVGGNDATSFSAGIRVGATRIVAFAMGGLVAGIGGVALSALTNSADSGSSGSYSLIAIAGVALGGTSLLGGRGGLLGSMFGAAAIFLVQDLLSSLQLPATLLKVTYGVLLLVAVVTGSLVGSIRKGRP